MGNAFLDSPLMGAKPLRSRHLAARLILVPLLGSTAGTIALSGALLLLGADPDGAEATFRLLRYVAPIAFVIGFVGALAGMLLVGVPTMLVLRRARRESAPAYAVGGALGALLPTVLSGADHGFEILPFMAYSVPTAVAFWRLVRLPALREAEPA